MNWELSVLNRIYKTLDFKLSQENINKLKNKTRYINQVTEMLNKYGLFKKGFRINSNGAIYKIKENKNTKYFNYITNYTFNIFCNFFEVEHKHLNYTNLDFTGLVNSQEKHIDGKVYADGLKEFLIEFLFTYELNKAEFKNIIQKINKYFEFRTFVIGNDISPYDIVLLSILHLDPNWKDREAIYKDSVNIRRWFDYLTKVLEIK
jgi:hypothetical protein